MCSDCGVGLVRYGAYCYAESDGKTAEEQERDCAEKEGHLWWPSDMYEVEVIKHYFPYDLIQPVMRVM